MTIGEIAIRMAPLWMLGILMIWLTFRSKHRDLIRITWASVRKWVIFLMGLTVYRFLVFHFSPPAPGQLDAVLWIPWQMTLTVFWEDAAHVLPLLLVERMLPSDWKWKRRMVMLPLLLFMQVSFGLGHVYQGVWSAVMLSFYIPLGMKIGREKGLGTMMLCHVLYDLTTILLIQYVVRTML